MSWSMAITLRPAGNDGLSMKRAITIYAKKTGNTNEKQLLRVCCWSKSNSSTRKWETHIFIVSRVRVFRVLTAIFEWIDIFIGLGFCDSNGHKRNRPCGKYPNTCETAGDINCLIASLISTAVLLCLEILNIIYWVSNFFLHFILFYFLHKKFDNLIPLLIFGVINNFFSSIFFLLFLGGELLII